MSWGDVLVFDSFQPHLQSAFSTVSVHGNPSRPGHLWCEIQVYDRLWGSSWFLGFPAR
jgi:hypothetical protein